MNRLLLERWMAQTWEEARDGVCLVDKISKRDLLLSADAENVIGEFGQSVFRCAECHGTGRVQIGWLAWCSGVHRFMRTCPQCNGQGFHFVKPIWIRRDH